MGGADGAGGRGVGGLEAEGLVEEHDVVVDGFGDADDGDLQAALVDFVGDGQAPRRVPSPPMTKRMLMDMRSRQSTISTGSWSPREEPRMVPPRSWISRDQFGIEVQDIVTISGDEAGVAVLEAVDVLDAVDEREGEDQAADDVVEAGADAAAGDDADAGFGGIEADFGAGPASSKVASWSRGSLRQARTSAVS